MAVRAFQKAVQTSVCVYGMDVGQPEVYHGHTLTSAISFEDAVKSVKKAAFVASEYPVIITIENHCSVPQQKIQAEILTRVSLLLLPWAMVSCAAESEVRVL